MDLDKRIKCVTDIYSVTDGNTTRQFSNEKGYFANNINDFACLKNCAYGFYKEFIETDRCFLAVIENSFPRQFRYFIPEYSLKPIEKVYRPYTLEEFKARFNIGWVIKFRGKHSGADYRMVFNGYAEYHDGDEPLIVLGSTEFTLKDLFEAYEWIETEAEGYHPFGVEE